MSDNLKIPLPAYVKELISALENAGFEAFAVGGCVRDSFLGLAPHDYDITTSALPEETERVLSAYKIIETGIKHGTVTVLSAGSPVEITTFRLDGEYADNRRPLSVSFTRSLKDDLSRRDFTVNAMAFSEKTGLVDLFGGQEDLFRGIIRTVGDPDERFQEDALRILRALRFAASYKFTVANATADAIHSNKLLLKNISGERTAVELNKLLCGSCADILREFGDVFAVIIPEIALCHGFEQHSKYHDRDVFEHIIATVSAVKPVPYLRLAMLFHDMGKPSCYKFENDAGHFKGHAAVSAEIAERVLSELKYDNATKEKVAFLVKRHDMPLLNDRRLIRHWLSKYGAEAFFDLIDVHIADDSGKAPEFQNRIALYGEVKAAAEEILAEKPCLSLKALAVNGNDLLAAGYKGKEVGEALDMLLDAVVDEKCANSRDALLGYLKENGEACI